MTELLKTKNQDLLFSINTNIFKEVLLKSVKCTSNLPFLPLSSMVGLCSKDGGLQLTTTDGQNVLRLNIDNIDVNGEFSILVSIKKLVSLIKSLTVETIQVYLLNDKVLQIIGNGKYLMPIALNDDGEFSKFPKTVKKEILETKDIEISDIMQIVCNNKNALKNVSNFEQYNGYFCVNEYTITTNGALLILNKTTILDSTVFFYPRSFELFEELEDEIMHLEIGEDKFYLTSSIGELSGNLNKSQTISYESVEKFSKLKYGGYCEVQSGILLSALKRIRIFLEKANTKGVCLEFNNNDIVIYDRNEEAIEKVRHNNINDVFDVDTRKVIKVDICIDLLISVLSPHDKEDVKIEFGAEGMIKFTYEKTENICALLG